MSQGLSQMSGQWPGSTSTVPQPATKEMRLSERMGNLVQQADTLVAVASGIGVDMGLPSLDQAQQPAAPAVGLNGLTMMLQERMLTLEQRLKHIASIV